MFGTYRTLLAFGVVAMHLGGVPMIGNYCVFGFYVLSGYLMTLITHTTYGYSASGMSRYALNRLLRIYPTYWAAVLLSLALIFLFGEEMGKRYHDAIFLPTGLTETLKNAFLIFAHDDRPRLVPPAWALTVELFFYTAIGLGLARNRILACVWLGVSVLYHLIGLYAGLSFGERYFPVYAASMPFATGAVIYHYRDKLCAWVKLRSPKVDQFIPLFIFVALLGNWGIAYLTKALYGFPFYASYLLCALMVVVLINRPFLPAIPRAFDKWAGDLSYPIYLIHLQAGLIVFVVLDSFGKYYGRMDPVILLAGTPLVIAMAWVLTIAVEKPTDKVRAVIKKAGV